MTIPELAWHFIFAALGGIVGGLGGSMIFMKHERTKKAVLLVLTLLLTAFLFGVKSA